MYVTMKEANFSFHVFSCLPVSFSCTFFEYLAFVCLEIQFIDLAKNKHIIHLKLQKNPEQFP